MSLLRKCREHFQQVSLRVVRHIACVEVLYDVAQLFKRCIGVINYRIVGGYAISIIGVSDNSRNLRLPNLDDVKEGIIAARIAAHAADLVKGIPGAQEWDDAMSKARVDVDFDKMISLSIDPEKARRYYESSKPECEGTCTMCGKMCPARTMKRILAGEDVSIR